MKYLFIVFSLIIIGCSRYQSLGLKPHFFGKKAKHIVWIQVPSLSLEQIAILKLGRGDMNSLTAFESFQCLGNLWSYNIYNLRPRSFDGFQSQILGSKNIKGTCDDFDRKSVWSYFEESGYEVGLVEDRTDKDYSLTSLSSCSNELNPLKSIYLWSRNKGKGDFKTFHYQEGTGLDSKGLYYDKSCQQKRCYVSLRQNVEKLWEKFSAMNARTFFIVRNFEIEKALKAKNISSFKDGLQELEKTIQFFQSKQKEKDVLLVVSSSRSAPVLLPDEGKQWASYISRGKNLFVKKTNILGYLWAQGHGAENFCGTYDESHVFKRFLWSPKDGIINLVF